MQDRTFPADLNKLKKLAAELSRFGTDEIPPGQRNKQRLPHIFRELGKYFEAIGEIDVEPELHIDALKKSFQKLILSYQNRQTRAVIETRNVDTNSHFRTLQEATDWCNKLKQLQEADYGSDLPTVQHELDVHHREQKQVDQFHAKVESCTKEILNFHSEELTLYTQHLIQLQKVYAELSGVSDNRMSDLDSLLDFIQSMSYELIWLKEKEETEVARDWSDKNLNIAALEQYYESLMSELEKREIQCSAVQDRGEALVFQHHPATKTIAAHMSALQAQWVWVLQLTLCLEVHLKHVTVYHSFYKDIRQAEQWLKERDETLNTDYSQCDFTFDQGERLLLGMQNLRDELNSFGDSVQTLTIQAQDVVPLKQRRQPVACPLLVQAICNYKQASQWVAVARRKRR